MKSEQNDAVAHYNQGNDWRTSKETMISFIETLFPERMLLSNYIRYEVWDKMTYPFQTSVVSSLKFGNG